jgi:serine/threonine-protein kinase HipA
MTALGLIKHARLLDVYISSDRVGQLAQNERGEIWFEYDPLWIKTGFPLTPLDQFSLKAAPFTTDRQNPFNGLHGVFNDALPDGWGLLLMDRTFKKYFDWDPHEITALDRLAYIGNRAMGALEFREAITIIEDVDLPSINDLATESILIQKSSQEEVLNSLAIYGGSPGGARPKVTVALEKNGHSCISGFSLIPENYDHWIVKFRTQLSDPSCMGRIELAYSKMARLAKIDMPKTKLISAEVRGKKEEFFAVQRFDRVGNDKKHVVSLAGMLEISHRSPSIDYLDLLKAVQFVTNSDLELEKAFRLMVFNVLAHNKDDHSKNFSFIYSDSLWKMTPAYDLTFSSGMNNQHSTAVMGLGLPTAESIKRAAKKMGIKKSNEIIREVYEAVQQWETIASEENISKKIISQYKKAIIEGPCFRELQAIF